jgi:adenine-specific DNA-methyltransferase
MNYAKILRKPKGIKKLGINNMLPIAHNIEMVNYVLPDLEEPVDFHRKSELGQFMTPSQIAHFMASLFDPSKFRDIRLLDPGAGLGALSTAFLDACFLNNKVHRVEIMAYEIDAFLRDRLEKHMKRHCDVLANPNFSPSVHVLEKDFIEEAVDLIQSKNFKKFTHAILNPPYKKINSQSRHRHLLQNIGIETVNLYTAFLALTVHLVEDGGEIVAIIPRSFCSGSYYKSFRELVLKHTSIQQIHLFNTRNKAFKEDGVLQENVIVHLIKGGIQEDVLLSFSDDDSFADSYSYKCPFEYILKNNDEEFFIRIPSESDLSTLVESNNINYSLPDIGVEVSTGPVVDFRLKEFLCAQPEVDTVPLLYPCHFEKNNICWPKGNVKKPNAIRIVPETEKWLWPNGFYVVVRRVSSKEEKRRIVASVVNPNFSNSSKIGFENHLNVFHCRKNELDKDLAYGLAAFLNSSQVDRSFRSFNGHTQVNATDLRSLKYPDRAMLVEIGKWVQNYPHLTQESIDMKIESLN